MRRIFLGLAISLLAMMLLGPSAARAAQDTVDITVIVPEYCAIHIYPDTLTFDFSVNGLTPCEWTYIVQWLDFQICCNTYYQYAKVTSAFTPGSKWTAQSSNLSGHISSDGVPDVWEPWNSWFNDYGPTPKCEDEEVKVKVGVDCDTPPDTYTGVLTLTLTCS